MLTRYAKMIPFRSKLARHALECKEERMNARQRRQFSRARFETPAVLLVADERHDCAVRDLSLKGALVSPGAAWTPVAGVPCLLEIALGAEDATIRMNGEVVHVGPDRVGVVWRETDLDSLTHLRRLLELNLGDADLMQRELGALLSD